MAFADSCSHSFAVRDYDLDATLASGQAFRWTSGHQRWVGVIGRRWVELHSEPDRIVAVTTEPTIDWTWLAEYLQVEIDLMPVLASFPQDVPMKAAVSACRGLRLLRQDPWECLASFILSSTKQIRQIQQIISFLCQRHGSPLATPQNYPTAYSFPSPEQVARASEIELRSCKMGFRAPFLLNAARQIIEGKIDLKAPYHLPLEDARAELQKLRGVGNKISDCVLLFAYGRQAAFPVDVWIMKVLRQLYFPRKKMNLRQLQEFAHGHFGPNAGYAQQYLFHYARVRMDRKKFRV